MPSTLLEFITRVDDRRTCKGGRGLFGAIQWFWEDAHNEREREKTDKKNELFYYIKGKA